MKLQELGFLIRPEDVEGGKIQLVTNGDVRVTITLQKESEGTTYEVRSHESNGSEGYNPGLSIERAFRELDRMLYQYLEHSVYRARIISVHFDYR